MPLILQGVVGVIGPQLKPVPGTISPINGAGRISPVRGFRARRVVPCKVGWYNTGGFPPHLGSNRSKVNAEASPPLLEPPCSGGAHLYMRRPTSRVRFRRTFQVSWTNHAHVY